MENVPLLHHDPSAYGKIGGRKPIFEVEETTLATRKRYFRLRESPVENLTFIAMMVAFDAIVSLIAGLLPLSAIFVMLLVPLTSAAVALFCKAKFVPVYLFAGFGICLAVSAWNIANTVFYVLPAMVTGLVYGLLWKAKVPASANLFISTLVSLALFYASLYFLRAVTGVDMVTFLLNAIRKGDDPLAPNIFPLFGFAYSLAQMVITHAFIQPQFDRLSYPIPSEDKMLPFHPLIAAVFSIISAIFAFFNAKIGYLALGFSVYWLLFSIYGILRFHRSWTFVLMGVFFFGGWLLFAAIYQNAPAGNGLTLVSVPVGFLAISIFLNYVLLRNGAKQPKI